ncbi:MAG: hypothetical protein JW861_12175 [Bacteroidales bacterium]|nr:hypothetical protein [Bacteroidales bacterium]
MIYPDPLEVLFGRHGYDHSLIERVACGSKYVGVMLKNGNIGVCATLGENVGMEMAVSQPCLQKRGFRIIYQAFLNALLNYGMKQPARGDITAIVDPGRYGFPVMIGYFRPVVARFRDMGISFPVFDHHAEPGEVTDPALMPGYLSRSDAIILTATCIAHDTFARVMELSNTRADIFLLGPSSPLFKEFPGRERIIRVFGTAFQPFDHRVLDVIGQGHGTRVFMPYGMKVVS